jgi:putative transposase
MRSLVSVDEAILGRSFRNVVSLKLIQLGKPNQSTCVESFNGRLRDECQNEHCFTNNVRA